LPLTGTQQGAAAPRKIERSGTSHVVRALQLARRRLRGRMWPILQTAAAAVAAWYLALALLGGDRPLFAPIAAVIALGATVGQRGQRAVELVGGVILGILVADLIVAAIGTGPWQAGVMVVLAMGSAVALGGRELLVAEAAVSAILIATLPGAGGFPPERFLEALIGGGVALLASVMLFPPDPALLVGRALNRLFADLGRTLGDTAAALEHGDLEVAERAQEGAQALAAHLVEVRREQLDLRETVRFALPRRGARSQLERIERSLGAVDYATRDAAVLARNALRFLRAGAIAPEPLHEAVHALADAVWELAASYDDERRVERVRELALGAATQASGLAEDARDLRLAEVVTPVRSVAVDLVRAAESVSGVEEAPRTDELLT
jgi:uncharacterized membrane protein YgaE (UPF0421/DUF939 family)